MSFFKKASAVAKPDLVSGGLFKGLMFLVVPMAVGIFLQNLQSVIDLFWIGKLGSDAVAALALCGTVLMLVFPVVFGITTGTVALVARNIGEGNLKQASHVGGQALFLGFIAGLCFGVVGFVLAPKLCLLLGASPEVARIGTGYLRIVFVGSFTVFLIFVGASILQGAGNSVVPMFALGLANVLNLLLDPVLIFGMFGVPKLGVAGAALATVLSQGAAVVLVLVLLASGVENIVVKPAQWCFDRVLAWKILKIGIPGSGMILARAAMNLVFMRIVAAYGTIALAAYGIGLRIDLLVLMPAFAFGSAAATMVGQNLGAGQPQRAQDAALLAVIMDVCTMVVGGSILMVFAPDLVGFFDSSPEVIRIGSDFLRLIPRAYVFAALSIVLARAMQGAGDTVSPFVCTVVCLWFLQVPLAFILPKINNWGLTGVWYAIVAAVCMHGVVVTAVFAHGRWKHKKL